MSAIVIAIATLFIGPLLALLFRYNYRLYALIDGFNVVTVTILALALFLPEFFADFDLWLAVFVALGFLLPNILERQFLNFHRQIHNTVLLLTIAGLLLHAMLDGAAISPLLQDPTLPYNALTISVIVHQVPMSLAIWGVYMQQNKWLQGMIFIMSMALFTLAGYLFAANFSQPNESKFLSYFEMFVIGSLLHVVFHRSIVPQTQKKQSDYWKANANVKFLYEGTGALVSLACLWVLFYFELIKVDQKYLTQIGSSLYFLWKESSVWVVAIVMSCIVGRYILSRNKPSYKVKLRRNLRYGLIELVDRYGPLFFIVLVVLAVFLPLLSFSLVSNSVSFLQITAMTITVALLLFSLLRRGPRNFMKDFIRKTFKPQSSLQAKGHEDHHH